MRSFVNIWKTLWKQLGKTKAVLLLMIQFCMFLRWLSAPETTDPLLHAGIGFGIFAAIDLALTCFVYLKMRPSLPYYQFTEDYGSCDEAVDLHRQLFPDPKPGERLSRADLLLSLFRTDEAEAELAMIRPQGLTGIERLRYYNGALLVYAYTGRRQQAMELFQSCRQEAGRLAENYPVLALSYFNTAELVLAMNGDAEGSEMYCRYEEQEAAKKRGDEKIRSQLLAAVTRTERMYALGQYDAAAAMEAQVRTEIRNSSAFRKEWMRAGCLRLLDHAKTLAPQPVPPAPSVDTGDTP